jgi:HAD superfamily hydrolase (TIGR01509 family)
MIKAAIFDYDGVLVDSRDANVSLIHNLFNKAGYDKPSRSKILQNFHLPLWQTIEQLLDDPDHAEVERLWKMGHSQEFRAAELIKLPVKITQTIEVLGKTLKLGIASGSLKQGIDELFDRAQIKPSFSTIITYGDYKNPKPDPEPLLLASKQLGIKPMDSVYIGDSAVDIEASKAAGMKSVLLSDKFLDGADLHITRFAQLPQAIAALG